MEKLIIPDSFFLEETRSGHLVTTETKKLWGVELEILNQFINICQKYNLAYWADGGTLLGAVRHNGFIPWDDDIDIMMMREDFDKFCEVAPLELESPLFLQNWNSDLFGYAYARLINTNTSFFTKKPNNKMITKCGIYIDIFPFDKISDDDFQLSVQNFKLQEIYKKMSFFFVLKRQGKISEDELRSKLAEYSSQYYNEETKYNQDETIRFANLSMSQWRDCNIKYFNDGFNEPIMMQFEMLRLPIPRDYDKVLTDLYGDWHKFVKDASLHTCVLFDTDKPYTEYIS